MFEIRISGTNPRTLLTTKLVAPPSLKKYNTLFHLLEMLTAEYI